MTAPRITATRLASDNVTSAQLARQEMADASRPADLWHDTASYLAHESTGDDGSCYMPEEDEPQTDAEEEAHRLEVARIEATWA